MFVKTMDALGSDEYSSASVRSASHLLNLVIPIAKRPLINLSALESISVNRSANRF